MAKLDPGGLLIPLLVLAAAVPASAQMDSDISVAELSIGPSSKEIASVRRGYDNQPWFTRDGGSILYARMEDDETDVFRHDLEEAKSTRVTNTPGWKQSPTELDGSEDFLALGSPTGTHLAFVAVAP